MKAMVLRGIGGPLSLEERPDPLPAKGQIRVHVEACAVCRTDLHVVDGELPNPKLPLVPGHEIVGIVDAAASGLETGTVGTRVGIPWLFTGYTRDGGFATHVVANAAYAFPLNDFHDPVATAPLLCAGLIGWRSLRLAGDGERIGLYGFGAAAHILAQICRWQGRDVYAFTRGGDSKAQSLALTLGAKWAGSSNEAPPALLDAAIVFAPAGELVPQALSRVRKGGTVVCSGIHMSDIPQFPYRLMWEERKILSVANLTRDDAYEFFGVAQKAGARTTTHSYPLSRANDALNDLRNGQFEGAAVLVP